MDRNNGRPIQDTEDLNDVIEKLRKELKTYQYLCDEMRKVIDNVYKQVAQLEHEKSSLIDQIGRSKHEYLHYLHISGKSCAQNCVLCVILWICHHKLLLFPCGCQLLFLLFRRTFYKIKREDLVCHKLTMEIFLKSGLVKIVHEAKYPTEMEARLKMINEVWSIIMTMSMDINKRVLILGRVAKDTHAVGHAILCDLETTNDGKVTIHDPQNERFGIADKQSFRDHVKGDKGIMIYSVNLIKLREIIEQHEDILHETFIHVPN